MHEVRGVCATPLVHIGYAPAYGMPNDGWRMKKLGITTSSFLKKRIIIKMFILSTFAFSISSRMLSMSFFLRFVRNDFLSFKLFCADLDPFRFFPDGWPMIGKDEKIREKKSSYEFIHVDYLII